MTHASTSTHAADQSPAVNHNGITDTGSISTAANGG